MTVLTVTVRPAGQVPWEAGHDAVEVNVDGKMMWKPERSEVTVAVAVPEAAELAVELPSVMFADAEAGAAMTVAEAATIAPASASRAIPCDGRRNKDCTSDPNV